MQITEGLVEEKERGVLRINLRDEIALMLGEAEDAPLEGLLERIVPAEEDEARAPRFGQRLLPADHWCGRHRGYVRNLYAAAIGSSGLRPAVARIAAAEIAVITLMVRRRSSSHAARADTDRGVRHSLGRRPSVRMLFYKGRSCRRWSVFAG